MGARVKTRSRTTCARSELQRSPPLPSYLLTPRVGDVCFVKLDLQEETQVHRAGWYHPSLLWTDLREDETASLQVPVLQRFRKERVRRLLFPQSCQVTSSLLSSRSYPSVLVTHCLCREAAQMSRVPPCAKCRMQPQTIRDSCLRCNPPPLKSTESRLEELNLRDPTAASRMFRDLVTRPWPIDRFSSYR